MQLFDTRLDLLKELIPRDGVYAEVGVLKGEFAAQIKQQLNPSKLFLIDRFEGKYFSGDKDGNNYMCFDLHECYEQIVDLYKDDPTISVLKHDSITGISCIPNESLDMIYIDADHSYQMCYNDLNAAWPKVKKDGFICGHDLEIYALKAENYYVFEVKKAVNDFCAKFRQTICAKALDGCVSFAIQKRTDI